MTSASLIIPSRGGATRLPVLLGALAQQTHADLEVVVVLDGDIDNSRAAATAWTAHLDLTIVEFPDNRGRSAALNAGFETARGDILIRCDDDLEPRPEHVARHVAQHAAGPVGVIGLCPNVLPDTPYTRAYGATRDAMFRRQAYAMPPDQRWRLWGANVSVRADTYRRIGPYDLAYRAYGFEDVDWGYRLHRDGIPILLDPALEAPHHGAATTTAIRARRAYHSGAARHTFEARHGSAPLGAAGPPAGIWGRTVATAGARLGPRGIGRLARLADTLADPLPRYAAEKLIAFTVESAAVAGRHHPDETDSGF